MELRQLEYVLAVAEELHFGRAAERLHVAQQTVSEQVARLERELGGPLFERTSRRVRLTAAGEAFVPEARRALAQVRHAVAVGRGGVQVHPLRLGFAPSSGPHLSAVILPEVARRLPGQPLLPVAGFTLALLTEVRDRRVDVALVWHPELAPDLAAVRLFTVPVAIALPEDSPLARHGRLPHAEVAGRPLVMLVPRQVHPRLHDHLLSAIAGRRDGAALSVRVVAEASSMDQMLPLVVAGTGLGVTFDNLTGSPAPGIAFRRMEPPEPSAACWAVWRSDDQRPAVASLVAALARLGEEGVLVQGR